MQVHQRKHAPLLLGPVDAWMEGSDGSVEGGQTGCAGQTLKGEQVDDGSDGLEVRGTGQRTKKRIEQ